LTAPRRVLIVGSYPPIPLPAAAATVAAVRRAWAAGEEVTVVSPRVSAAHLAVPVVGILAGRRLSNLRRHTSATRAVVVVEPGVPVPIMARFTRVGTLVQWLTVRGILRAFGGFEQVTVVRVGPLGIPSRIETLLVGGATAVIDHPHPANSRPGGITPLGPVEVLPKERPRQLAGLVARRLLGRRAEVVRARLGAVLRR
jgi:hypothetical protein